MQGGKWAKMKIEVSGLGDRVKTPIGDTEIIDYSLVLHKSGKPFTRYLYKDWLKMLAADMQQNTENHYDNVVVIEGPEGSGKSNLQYELCELYDPNFTLSEGYVYNVEEFKEKISEKNDKKRTFWLDEATNVQNNRKWSSIDSQDFIMLLETMRSRGWCLILCIPSFERLDVYIREHRIRYLIRCEPMEFEINGKKERGYFEAKKKNEYGKMKTIGYGEYEEMSKKVYEEYNKIKQKSQERMITDITQPEKAGSKYKKKYEDISKREYQIMYRLYKSGSCTSEQLKMMFEIENEQTFRNRLSKGKKMVAENDP